MHARVHDGATDLQRESALLDGATAEFVSARLAELQGVAADEASAVADIEWIQRTLSLLCETRGQDDRLAALRQRLAMG